MRPGKGLVPLEEPPQCVDPSQVIYSSLWLFISSYSRLWDLKWDTDTISWRCLRASRNLRNVCMSLLAWSYLQGQIEWYVLCALFLKGRQVKTRDKVGLRPAGQHLTSNKWFLLRDHTYWHQVMMMMVMMKMSTVFEYLLSTRHYPQNYIHCFLRFS